MKTEAKHTPVPANFPFHLQHGDEETTIIDSCDNEVCQVFAPDVEREEIGAFIVAACNHCAGISNAALESGVVGELVASLKKMRDGFHSCISDGNGELEGDKEAIAEADALLERFKAKPQEGNHE